MSRALPQDHFCAWRDEAERLSGEVAQMRGELDALKRHVYGKRSEKMPPIEREVRKGAKADAAAARATRATRAAAKAAIETETVSVPVPPAARECPQCRVPAKPAGTKAVVTYSYVPGHFRRRVHARETLSCGCGYIVSAPPPERAFERTPYEASLVAHLVVAKCADATPLYRLEKQFARAGVPMSRSTMTDLFHRAGEHLRPLAERTIERIAACDVVQADETTLREQTRGRRTWLWTFLGGGLVGYVYSHSRSGDTPAAVLGGTRGTLVVDAYTGYNPVTDVDGRARSGCLAHARRKFFDALSTAPEAQYALDAILAIYRVEHEAKQRGVVRTAAHREMRQTLTRAVLDELHAWLIEQRPRHLPKGPMGIAIRYMLGQWGPLTRFVDDENIPPDNNRAEAALRVAALGRKNFLFVGHEAAGRNLAVLYTLVASCEANGKNPWLYLRDVLTRIGTHPASRIDELLPDRWEPAPATSNAPAAAA